MLLKSIDHFLFFNSSDIIYLSIYVFSFTKQAMKDNFIYNYVGI